MSMVRFNGCRLDNFFVLFVENTRVRDIRCSKCVLMLGIFENEDSKIVESEDENFWANHGFSRYARIRIGKVRY